MTTETTTDESRLPNPLDDFKLWRATLEKGLDELELSLTWNSPDALPMLLSINRALIDKGIEGIQLIKGWV